MLLTLVNLEQVAAETPELERLLANCSGGKFLATSRKLLRAAGEQILPRPAVIQEAKAMSRQHVYQYIRDLAFSTRGSDETITN
jgi:predicted ATPase